MQTLDDIKLYAAKNSIPIMRDGGIDFICSYIKEHNIKRILEIGTAIGFSAIEFANVAHDITVTTIELDIDRHIKAKQNIHDSGLDDRINAIHGDALKVELMDGNNRPQQFDMIFIDAAKGQYINFFQKYKVNLAPGGVFISDNLSFHGMVDDLTLTHNYSTIKLVKKIRKYIDFLKTNKEFTTQFFEYGDGV
ncbi:MAG: O-methyltransferase, partial [Treponema sp.]|nr:O-methyltransferase [Treponema sp.]